MPSSSVNSKLLSIIDGLLLENEGNVAYISVTQCFKGPDDRMIMFGFSKECLNLILFDVEDFDNVFENEFIEHCLKIFYCHNYETRMKELIEFLGKMTIKKENDPKKTVYKREMNTIFGIIKAEFCLRTINVEIEGMKFVIFLSVLKEEENCFISGLMKNKNNFVEKSSNELKKKKKVKTSSDWEHLMKFYYPKILEVHSHKSSKVNSN